MSNDYPLFKMVAGENYIVTAEGTHNKLFIESASKGTVAEYDIHHRNDNKLY